MVKKHMFKKIQEMKRKGCSRNKASAVLGLDRKTVSKYWKMDAVEYENYRRKVGERESIWAPWFSEIYSVYEENEFRKLNMASVYDVLEEKHGRLPGTEKSLRNYISHLLQTGDLEIMKNVRMYEKVPELPFGKQMQIDFGEYRFRSGLKVYIFAAVLSASRFKYVTFQEKPFTTMDVIHHLLDSFDYCGGVVEELVIDQDAVLVAAENSGNIIHTKNFAYFLEEMGLKSYVCRKADPESKGKIENVIKYVQYNFCCVRDFESIEEARRSLADWLMRRANGKLSQATFRAPDELLELEKKSLHSPRNSIFRKDFFAYRDTRKVNDQSLISLAASSYSVPDAYVNRVVEIYPTETTLFVFDPKNGKEIARHNISTIAGQKIINPHHFRQNSRSLESLKAETRDLFALEAWKRFTEANFTAFPRYQRDQCLEALKNFKADIETFILSRALEFCLEAGTISFPDLRDTYQYFHDVEAPETDGSQAPTREEKSEAAPAQTRNRILSRPSFLPSLQVAGRDVEEYSQLADLSRSEGGEI